MNEQEEQAVDRVIAVLRAAQPSDGMEQRVLQALRSRENASIRATERHYGTWRHGWITVAAGTCVAAGVLLVAHTPHTRAPLAENRPSPATLPVPLVAPLPQKQAVTALVEEKERPVQPKTTHRVELARAARATGTVHEVSYPAPVAPLSPQEKALLQIAQHPSPEVIALLDPVVREKRYALEEAAFRKYANQSESTPSSTDRN